jgi:two-component system cell cycle sensor histidine kinase/response regulator CckA
VLSDATELKSLEAQFVHSQKMQAIGQLAGGVAHDFNNLLTAITGHCDLLLLRHDDQSQDFADLTQINQNANRAAALVSQLLAFSRKQTLRPEPLNMRDTLADLTHLLNRLVGEKVELDLTHDPRLRHVRADKRQLEQVLMNLVVNARDAMPDGGTIEIQTQNWNISDALTRDRVTIPVGEYVKITVRDQGCGIAADKLSKIFEPFYTTKRIGERTGLGLSTAYGIVKQTGGYIFVDSTLGRGTEFTLIFPAIDPDPVSEMPPIEVNKKIKANHGVGVILLVEDKAPVRTFASRTLKLRGHQVIEACSAEEALDKLRDKTLRVDVFVTDIVMPGRDGPSWVKEALVERPNTRVVFVSGYAEDVLETQQASVPNSVFLPKPFSLDALTQTVQNQMH